MGYNDNNVIKPLYLELQQMTGYITIKYGKKVEKLVGIDFNTKPYYGDDEKYIKTKKNMKTI